jgi:creatinine amidohydrolase
LRLDRLTWPEVAEHLKRDRRLIIPAGTCEQHSKHLPLNTDTLVTEHIADYLSGETGALVAPTINYGVNLPCDSCYAGTSSLAEADLRKVLLSLTEWWEGQGFEQFYVVSAHGDPFHLRALGETGRASIYLMDLYDLDLEDMLDGQSGCGHACEVETSVMMHLFPETVRAGLIEDFETPFEEFKAYLHHLRSDPIEGSPGCQGYPSMASAAKGAAVVSRMKARALRWITET